MTIEHDGTPPNYDGVDLSAMVTNLHRVKAKNRARLANSELTRAFLNSGLALTRELFDGRFGDPGESAPPTLAYLSRPRVLNRTQADYPELVPTEAKFRDRWTGHQDFLEDFVAYALYARHISARQALAAWSSALSVGKNDFSGTVHRIAYEGAKLVLDLPAYRLQLLTVASAAADPGISHAIKHMYALLTGDWFVLFARVVEASGFSLRPGITARTFNIILQAVTEGLGLRLLAGLDEPLMDHERRESVLGTAALALFVGLVDRGDGLTVEEAANECFARGPQGS